MLAKLDKKYALRVLIACLLNGKRLLLTTDQNTLIEQSLCRIKILEQLHLDNLNTLIDLYDNYQYLHR